MTTAELIVSLARWWLIAGAAVAVVFLTIGVDRIDEDSRGAYAFRPLMIPAILLIWPLVLWRWMRLETATENWMARYQPPRAVHLPTAFVFAAAIAFSILAGLAVRQTWPADVAPQQLSEPEQ
ncbi:MAG: hypothetical protein AAGG56_15475 [Pseudomonadota bacterium]